MLGTKYLVPYRYYISMYKKVRLWVISKTEGYDNYFY